MGCNLRRRVTMGAGMETNKFLDPGEQRAAKVENLFATIAPRYDLINDLQSLGLHRLWKRAMIQMADVKPGRPALDLCCGTGDVAFALRRGGAEVVALDFSPAMLAVAQARAKHKAASAGAPVRFLRGDALNIPFPDASFDVVTVAYGLRNLADWERGLEEMWRVGRPGARLLVLDFGKPDQPALARDVFQLLEIPRAPLWKIILQRPGDPRLHLRLAPELPRPARRGREDARPPLPGHPSAQPHGRRHEHQPGCQVGAEKAWKRGGGMRLDPVR